MKALTAVSRCSRIIRERGKVLLQPQMVFLCVYLTTKVIVKVDIGNLIFFPDAFGLLIIFTYVERNWYTAIFVSCLMCQAVITRGGHGLKLAGGWRVVHIPD